MKGILEPGSVESNGADLRYLRNQPSRVIYVAGPLYSSGQLSDNLYKAIRAGHALRCAGEIPIIPHLFWFTEMAIGVQSKEFWMGWDLDLLGRSQVVVRLPGSSEGSDEEVARAALKGIPVFYGVENYLSWLEYPEPTRMYFERGAAISEYDVPDARTRALLYHLLEHCGAIAFGDVEDLNSGVHRSPITCGVDARSLRDSTTNLVCAGTDRALIITLRDLLLRLRKDPLC